MLKQLREKNIARDKLYPGAEKIDLAFRMVELAGEVGELGNLIKKVLREERGIQGSSLSREVLLRAVAEEIGDVLICLDLVAMELDIDIEQATRAKFNKTSVKLGIETRLEKE